MLHAMEIGWLVAVGIMTCFVALIVMVMTIGALLEWWERRA
jgi:uncharacterized membrane protein YphA (DoxX/SURF4 family)